VRRRRPVRQALPANWRAALPILALSGILAVAVVRNATVALGIATCIAAFTVALSIPRRVDQIFLYSLLFLLAGYALLGRPFAGIGLPPVFIGEVVLALGLLSAIGNGWPPSLLRAPIIRLLLAFMVWGLVRTIPYLNAYRLDALRDAVIWGYGGFALLLTPLIIRRDLVWRLPQLYARLLPWIVVIAPAWLLFWIVSDLRGIPGTAITYAKGADPAPHLAGAAAFLLAGASTRRAGGRTPASLVREWGVWLALLAGVVVVGSITRGGLLAIIVAILTVAMMEPFKAGKKLLLVGATAVLLGAVWLGWQSVQVLSTKERAIHPEQIVKNLTSIGGESAGGLENTRDWRIQWWEAIIDYTVHGEYFWNGKGFGVNLTYDDGIEPDPYNPSRNPHNGHLTILARAGVPGLALWTALQLWFAFSMVRGSLRARRAANYTLASLFAWVLAFWIAFLINATFDPSLEGPQGGIWFWCVFAYGIALTMVQAQRIPVLPPRVVTASPERVPVFTTLGRV
jgi:O-Antigen ligase